MILSAAYCKMPGISKDDCDKNGLRSEQVSIALDDPKRPKYWPRQPAPPKPPAGDGDVAPGGGGQGARGTGGGGGGNDDRTQGPNPGRGKGGKSGNGTGTGAGGGGGGDADKHVPGARDGVKGGAADCGKDEKGNPIDCDTQSLIQITDPSWDVDGPIAQCPAFLQPYNCLGTGTQLAGDLTSIRNAPYFFAAREKICRAKVMAWVGPGFLPGARRKMGRSRPGHSVELSRLLLPHRPAQAARSRATAHANRYRHRPGRRQGPAL